jgi:hypothetical protein
MGPKVAGRLRYTALAVLLGGSALVIGVVSGSPDGRTAKSEALADAVGPVATSSSPNALFWADTVRVDALDGTALSVHSVRHPELVPYIVGVDHETIFVPTGPVLAPQPGVEVGSSFYFTGFSGTRETPPPYVRALRIFR